MKNICYMILACLLVGANLAPAAAQERTAPATAQSQTVPDSADIDTMSAIGGEGAERALVATPGIASSPVQMADGLYRDGKIYVVVTVLLILFAGFVSFLLVWERRLAKLEKDMRNGVAPGGAGAGTQDSNWK